MSTTLSIQAAAKTPSITTVLAWEFWSSARLRMLSVLAGLACMNALYFDLVTPESGSLPLAGQKNLFFATFFTNIVMIVLLLLINRGDSSSHLDTRAFLLPLPTWRLVLLKMIFPVVAAGLLWVGVRAITLAATSEAATGGDWPMLEPALIASVYVAWGLAVFALPLEPKALKIGVGMVLLAAPLRWTFLRMDAALLEKNTLWIPWTVNEFAVVALFLVSAYGVAVFGVSRARRGVHLGIKNLTQAIDRLTYRWSGLVQGTFRSPATAQLWFEWRQKGWHIPLHVFLGLIGLSFLMSRGDAGFSSLLPIFTDTAFNFFLLMLVPPMIGCLMGRFSQSSQEAAIDVYRAARPLSNTALANALLKVGALSLMATWATAFLTMAAILAVTDLLDGGQQLELARQMVLGSFRDSGWLNSLFTLGGLFIASWANMAMVMSIFLTGRNKVVAALFLGPYALGIGVLSFQWLLPERWKEALYQVGPWFIGFSALVITAAAFIAAQRKGLIRPIVPWAALGLWLTLGTLFAWHYSDGLRRIMESAYNLERSVLVLAPGVLALALAPLALAPLAVSWNRHR